MVEMSVLATINSISGFNLFILFYVLVLCSLSLNVWDYIGLYVVK